MIFAWLGKGLFGHPVLCRPAAAILRDVEKYVVSNSSRLTPKDVKDFIVAFTAMEAPPSHEMVNAAILQLPGHFKDTLPKDLAVLITVSPCDIAHVY